MTQIHDFKQSKVSGDEGEQFLDTYFRRNGYKVEPVTMHEQKQDKVDRKIVNLKSGKSTIAEYKTDAEAKTKHNIFVEVVSNAEGGSPGWLWASKAEWLITLIPDDCILIAKMAKVRECYHRGWSRTAHVSVQNKSKQPSQNFYYTIGALVSIDRYIKETEAVKLELVTQPKAA